MSTAACGIHPHNGRKLRTDVSATLFLTNPDDYDGGELEVEDTYGRHSVKLAAGDMVVYPATSLHQVTPITRGVRTVVLLLGAEPDPRRDPARACSTRWTRPSSASTRPMPTSSRDDR